MIPVVFGLGVYLNLRSGPSRLEALAVSWGVGWATVNVVSFTANQYAGVPLDGTFYLALSLAMGGSGAILVLRRRKQVTSLLRAPLVPSDLRGRTDLGILLLIAGFLAFVAYKALIVWPAHPDELIYHMELAKVAWQTGSLPLQPGLDLASQGTAYPDLLVTQQLWIYLGAGSFDPNLVRPIVPVYTALLLLLVFVEARRLFGPATAGVAVAALLSLFSFSSLTFLLLDELPVAFFSCLALHFALETLRGRATPAWSALIVGLAALVKYDGLAASFALGIALPVSARWRAGSDENRLARDWRGATRYLATFFPVALVWPLPVLLRNSLRLGNPVYPYFFGGVDSQINPALLSQVNVPAVVAALVTSEAVSLLGTVIVAAVLLGLLRFRSWSAPERLLVLFFAFYLPPYLSIPLLGSQIRYLAPVLPAMAIFGGRQMVWWLHEASKSRRILGASVFLALVAVSAGLAVWGPFYGSFDQQVAVMTAEVFAVLIALVLLLGTIASGRASGPTRKVLTACLILILIVPGVIAVADEKSEANPLTWTPNVLPQTQDAYLSARLYPDWQMWTWMNAHLPPNATVLSFEPRLFYLSARVVSAMSPEMMPTYNLTLPQAVSYLRTFGVGYVLDSRFGDSLFLNYLYVGSSPIFQNLGNRTCFTMVHQEGTTILYAIVGVP